MDFCAKNICLSVLTPDKIFRVLAPEKMQAYLNDNSSLRERIFALQCGRDVYEIVCVEIQNGEIKTIIIPEFLIPGRHYPIYVYIYAMVLYSSNPEMGQRKAAEQTRKRFDLVTFSHSTLCRVMKSLEALISTNEEKPEPEQLSERRFPSVGLTVARRNVVLAYLKEASGGDAQLTQEPSHPQLALNLKHPPYTGAFIDACHRIVEYTFKKYRRLLL